MPGDELLTSQPGLFPLAPALGDPEQVPLHRSVSDGIYIVKLIIIYTISPPECEYDRVNDALGDEKEVDDGMERKSQEGIQVCVMIQTS